MAACKHTHYRHSMDAKTMRIEPWGREQPIFILRAWCSACNEPFLFKGKDGFSTEECTVSPGGTILIIPWMFPLPEELGKKTSGGNNN